MTRVLVLTVAMAALLVVVVGCASIKGRSMYEAGTVHPSPKPALTKRVAHPAPPPRPAARPAAPGTETYEGVEENAFLTSQHYPLSTFAIDVDTASYANVRRFLNQGSLPPKSAVRVEELVNYFDYGYPEPADDAPFAVDVELAECPWKAGHRLARIGLKARDLENEDRPAANLVFLLDVSGSMSDANKLPLVKTGLRLLVPQLRAKDRVAIVTYAGTSRRALRSTRCGIANKRHILDTIDRLTAGGSTHGSAGLRQAYEIAGKHRIRPGANRVILATDGDFNVGITDDDELEDLIVEQAKGGVFLTVLGFGMGNLKDAKLETLADKGNGHYAYVDTLSEARKVLLEQMAGTLVTVAKDVKLQVEFNPLRAAGYRLVGYENRLLRAEDFKDDAKDAGDMGAGHTVTALYEIVPAGLPVPGADVDALRYQTTQPTEAAAGNELLTVKVRYKKPRADESTQLAFPIHDTAGEFHSASPDFRFASAVAAFGQVLRDSPHRGDLTYDAIIDLAQATRGHDEYGYRAEFVTLVRNARALDTQ